MSLNTAILSLSVCVVICTAQQLGQGDHPDEYGWARDNSYQPQQQKRGFGKLKFGKRPFGSIKFGKRVPEPSLYRDYLGDENDSQFLGNPSKRYTDMLDNLYFQSLINNLKSPDDAKNKRMAGNVGDKRGTIKFGKRSFGPVENDLMTDKERAIKQSLDSKYGKSPYASF